MSLLELLATLKTKDIQLALKGEQLSVQGNKQALSDPAILAALREHKPALIELIKAGEYPRPRPVKSTCRPMASRPAPSTSHRTC